MFLAESTGNGRGTVGAGSDENVADAASINFDIRDSSTVPRSSFADAVEPLDRANQQGPVGGRH